MAELQYITINAVRYPCESWGKVQQGEPLAINYIDGWPDGVGDALYRSNKRGYYNRGWDVTSPPYIRTGPKITTIDLSSGGSAIDTVDTTKPFYVIPSFQTSGDQDRVVYLLNAASAWKLHRDTNVLDYGTLTADVTYGRPVKFDNVWRVPRGTALASPAAVNLIPLADASTYAQEFLVMTADVCAGHFGILQNESVNNIVRSFRLTAETYARKLELSADATTFTPQASLTAATGFEVGDDSFEINDILNQQGELVIVRTDGPYRFDGSGNSVPLQTFTAPNTLTTERHGSNSVGHSAYAYWVYSSGLYLLYGDVVRPVGIEVEPYFHVDPNADLDTSSFWTSGFAVGRWLYAVRHSQLWQGYIKDNGEVTWYGPIFSSQVAGTGLLRVAGDGFGPSLWIIDSGDTNVYRIDLLADGSTREALTAARGSSISAASPEILTPSIDMGRGDRLKQLRKFWFLIERIGTGMSVQAVVQLDGAANASWGAAATGVTGAGLYERIGVAGTSDTFRRLKAGFTSTGQDGTTTGAIIEKWGIEAHSADIWSAKIPLKMPEDTGSQGIIGSAKNLRQLQHGQAIEVFAPGRNSSFTAHIYQVNEKTSKVTADAQVEYEFEVLIEAFNIETGVN